MKRLKLTKVIVSTLAVVSILVLNPIGVSAEWRQDNNGWWYADGGSWSKGWKQIDGKWYYFDNVNGYMVSDATVIGGYYLDSNGVWTDVSTIGDYQFYKQEAEIVNYIDNKTNTKVVIPDKIDGINVKRIGGYTFSRCTALTSITIPNSVTSIGRRAFSNCSNLESLEIPSGVTNIGVGAFSGCTSLKDIKIPSSVTSIGKGAFDYCENLTTFYVKSQTTKQLLINYGIAESMIIVNA